MIIFKPIFTNSLAIINKPKKVIEAKYIRMLAIYAVYF